MISATFNSESVWVFPYRPDGDRFELDLSLPTARNEGLTMREEREPLASGHGRTVRFSCFLLPSDAATFRTTIAAFGNRKVLVPFWPSIRLNSQTDTSAHSGLVRVWWNGGGDITSAAYEVRQSYPVAPTAPATLTTNSTTQTAPVLVCKFESMPSFSDPVHNGMIRADFEFVQVGDYQTDLIYRAATLTTHATVNGDAVQKLTLPVDWSGREMSSEIRIRRDKIGYGRNTTDSFYTHQPRMVHTISGLAVGGEEMAYLLKLFTHTRASVGPFYLQSEHTPNTFVYGRFEQDFIRFSWALGSHGARELANYSFTFRTLPSEEAIPLGETYKDTIGPVNGSGRWYGYELSDSANVWRWTSYDVPITSDGNTFTPQPVSHSTIRKSRNLQIGDTSLTVGIINGVNPILSRLISAAAEPLNVKIHEGLIDTPNDATVIYTGRVAKITQDGAKLSITVRPDTSWLTSEGPRIKMNKTCSAEFGDAKCGMSKAGVDRTLAAITAGVLDFTTSGFTDHVLASGFLRRPMPDGTEQLYTISDNFSLSGGHMGVRVFGAVSPAPTGAETWKVVRTCGGKTLTDCQALGNQANFRGFPWIPDSNPSVVPVRQNAQGGKK